jgi:hypothetical protein
MIITFSLSRLLFLTAIQYQYRVNVILTTEKFPLNKEFPMPECFCCLPQGFSGVITVSTFVMHVLKMCAGAFVMKKSYMFPLLDSLKL